MEVDYMVLADAATVADGKHYIHGAGWDVVYAAAFPVQHPLMAIAARLTVPWTATNHPHKVELDVVDADGGSVLPSGPLAGEVNVGRPPNAVVGDDQHLPLVFQLRNLEFEGSGTFSAVFRIDGSEEARSTFRVAELNAVG